MSSIDLVLVENDAELQSDHVEDKQSNCKGKCMKVIKDNLFMILILLGVAVGFGLGFGLRAATNSLIAEQWISKLNFSTFQIARSYRYTLYQRIGSNDPSIDCLKSNHW